MKLFRPIFTQPIAGQPMGNIVGQPMGQTSVLQPRFDDYFFEDQQSYRIQGPSYSFGDSGYYHDYEYQTVPSRRDPYDAPDPHHHQNLKENSHDHYIDYQDDTYNSEHFEVIHATPHDHPDHHHMKEAYIDHDSEHFEAIQATPQDHVHEHHEHHDLSLIHI